jgi:acyl-coenzyme A thioesterase PaaI-like protein
LNSELGTRDAQPLYEDCFVCGRANPIGLHISFFSEGEMVRTEFLADARHQGYPGLVHGGILYAVLDETIGRAAYLVDSWVMTGRMQVRYRQMAPIGERIICRSWIVRDRGRAMELAGEARLEDGTLLAEGSGLFLRLPPSRRAEMERRILGPDAQTDGVAPRPLGA